MDRIKACLDGGQAKRAVVIGAGYIGLEMVEALAGRGLQVTWSSISRRCCRHLMRRWPGRSRRRCGARGQAGRPVPVSATWWSRAIGLRSSSRRMGKRCPRIWCSISIGVDEHAAGEGSGLATSATSGAIAVNAQMLTDVSDIYAAGTRPR